MAVRAGFHLFTTTQMRVGVPLRTPERDTHARNNDTPRESVLVSARWEQKTRAHPAALLCRRVEGDVRLPKV
jgi:hypothetical protein